MRRLKPVTPYLLLTVGAHATFGILRKPDATKDAAEHAFHLMLQTCAACHAKLRKP